MSAHTHLNKQEVIDFLADYDVGELEDFSYVPGGITNSVYFVDTNKQRYILTVFEELSDKDLPFYISLTDHLSAKNFPCQVTLADRQGEQIKHLHHKPAVLKNFLPGDTIDQAQAEHCIAIANALGQIHTATADFPLDMINPRAANWRDETAKILLEVLPSPLKEMLNDEWRYQQQLDGINLPSGLIHADLFRDNAIFENGQLTGIIDFDYACNDYLLLDVAITVNDWCFYQGEFKPDLYQAFIQAYQDVRPFTEEEKQNWSAMLRRAALRFWLSRLYDQNFQASSDTLHKKDPEEFQKIIEFHRQRQLTLA